VGVERPGSLNLIGCTVDAARGHASADPVQESVQHVR
jgi:hypothetical protein